jgi:hypothetical protein
MEELNMNRKRTPANALSALLHSDRVRQWSKDNQTRYAAQDVLAYLTGSAHAGDMWADLKKREPQLAALVEQVDVAIPAGEAVYAGATEAVDVLDLAGVLRVVQSVPSARAERIKLWLADSATARLEEAEDPELAVLRVRRLYEAKGYSRQWIDSRLSAASARQDLAGEWYKRGAKESDQFRELTNELMRGAFGMDVEHYRQFKHLTRTNQNLRDHMTDLELVLTRLGEMTAVALHRDRNSRDYDALLRDAHDAGEITAKTRTEIERRRGKPVAYPGSYAA